MLKIKALLKRNNIRFIEASKTVGGFFVQEKISKQLLTKLFKLDCKITCISWVEGPYQYEIELKEGL